MGRIDEFFEISARGSTITAEIRGGVVCWMTMIYILLVNPIILHKASTPSDSFDIDSIISATAFTAAISSVFVGFAANMPFGIMPGMGLNAYFTFGMCQALGLSWRKALSCCAVSGLTLAAFVILGVCNVVQSLLGDHLKKAITVGIGLFSALIGFEVMGLVVASPVTLVTLGDMQLGNQELYLAMGGLLIITALLVGTKIRGAFFIGIWIMAICSWKSGMSPVPSSVFSMPKFGAVGAADFSGWTAGRDELFAHITGSLVLLFVALFDIAGVQYGLGDLAGLLRDGRVPGERGVFLSASLGTVVGAVMGTSPVIIANESSAGILEGSKTGLSAVVVGVMFAGSAFVSPLLCSVPHVATAVPLVLIGAFMTAPCKGIEWDDLRIAIPAFFIISLMPFTYSIHAGILAGIVMDVFVRSVFAGGTFFGFFPAVVGSKDIQATLTPHSPFWNTPTSIHVEHEERLKKLQKDLDDLGDAYELEPEKTAEVVACLETCLARLRLSTSSTGRSKIVLP